MAVWAGVGPPGGTTGLTAPAAGDGAVYVGSKAGLHAIDPKTRQELWRLKTSLPVASTPVVREGIVYFVTGTVGIRRAGVPRMLPNMGARLHALRLKAKE